MNTYIEISILITFSILMLAIAFLVIRSIKIRSIKNPKERWTSEKQDVQKSYQIPSVYIDSNLSRVHKDRFTEKTGRERQRILENYEISIAFPRLLSKRHSSLFLVQIYLPPARPQVTKILTIKYQHPIKEHIESIELKAGLSVKLRLSSPVITFSEPVIKKINYDTNIVSFVARPLGDCEPGVHAVVLSVSDAMTQIEYKSIDFQVKVVDFAFDHVSRPLLSKMTSTALGVGSLIIFVLTALEQVDKTFGLVSGTAASFLASAILIRFLALYHQPRATNIP